MAQCRRLSGLEGLGRTKVESDTKTQKSLEREFVPWCPSKASTGLRERKTETVEEDPEDPYPV